MAPRFSVPGLEAGEHTLAALRGRVVLLDFWATWCPPCVASMPALDRLHAKLEPAGLTVLALNQEPGDEARVRAFAARRGLSLPIGVDPGEVAAAYGVHGLPTSFLIDRAGRIRGSYRGIVSEARLEEAISGLLDEPVAP